MSAKTTTDPTVYEVQVEFPCERATEAVAEFVSAQQASAMGERALHVAIQVAAHNEHDAYRRAVNLAFATVEAGPFTHGPVETFTIIEVA